MASAGRTADGRSIHAVRIGKAAAESAGRTADGRSIHAIRSMEAAGRTADGRCIHAIRMAQASAAKRWGTPLKTSVGQV